MTEARAGKADNDGPGIGEVLELLTRAQFAYYDETCERRKRLEDKAHRQIAFGGILAGASFAMMRIIGNELSSIEGIAIVLGLCGLFVSVLYAARVLWVRQLYLPPKPSGILDRVRQANLKEAEERHTECREIFLEWITQWNGMLDVTFPKVDKMGENLKVSMVAGLMAFGFLWVLVLYRVSLLV